MTREAFIRKWLANKDFQYCEDGRAQMREDLDKVIDHAQQKLNIASVSGKRPAVDIDKLLHDFAKDCGFDNAYHMCVSSDVISTEHMKQFALIYQAACASGAVDTKPAREVCIKGGERLENGECAKCNLLWGKCCAELL